MLEVERQQWCRTVSSKGESIQPENPMTWKRERERGERKGTEEIPQSFRNPLLYDWRLLTCPLTFSKLYIYIYASFFSPILLCFFPSFLYSFVPSHMDLWKNIYYYNHLYFEILQNIYIGEVPVRIGHCVETRFSKSPKYFVSIKKYLDWTKHCVSVELKINNIFLSTFYFQQNVSLFNFKRNAFLSCWKTQNCPRNIVFKFQNQ